MQEVFGPPPPYEHTARGACYEIMAATILPALAKVELVPTSSLAPLEQAKRQTRENLASMIDWPAQTDRVRGLVANGELIKPGYLRSDFNRLSSTAFEDFGSLVELAHLAMPHVAVDFTTGVVIDESFGQVLKDSKAELLRVARLQDRFNSSKETFFQIAKESFKKTRRSALPKDLQDMPPALALITDEQITGGKPKLKWVKQASDWLTVHDELRINKAKEDSSRPKVCPAALRTTTVGERKTTLLYAFWDALIDKVYP